MKKIISVLLILVLLLSLGGCGKKATLADLLDCPVDSLENAIAFLKKAGYEINSTTDQSATFTFGNWDGQAYTTCISVKLFKANYGKDSADYDKEVEAMLEQVEALCGKPYNTNNSSDPGGMMKSNKSFYMYDGGKIVVNRFSTAGNITTTISIYPGANAD